VVSNLFNENVSPIFVLPKTLYRSRFVSTTLCKSVALAPGFKVYVLQLPFDFNRVCTVMENLEKSWNFKMVISRPGKVMGKN